MNSPKPSTLYIATLTLSLAAVCGCESPAPPPTADTNTPSANASGETSPSAPAVRNNAASLASARSLLAEGRYKDSIKIAEELVDQDANNTTHQFLLGEAAFMAGEMETSVSAFDKLVEINPRMKSSLWQRGLALYYDEKYSGGVEQFTVHQTVNTQDVENAVWHLLCLSKEIGVEEARKKLIPIQFDSRIPMKEIYRMFAGELEPADVLKAAESAIVNVEAERHQYLYFAHLYIGLFHEMNGAADSSLASMREAVKINPIEKDILMGQVAKVHLILREQKQTPAQQ